MPTVTGSRVFGPAAAFILGTTEPVGGSNVGTGIVASAPSANVTVDGTIVTYNATTEVYTVAAGQTVERKIFPGFVNLAAGATIRNCLVSGPPAEHASDRALVQGPTTGSTRATVSFCTIDPTVASPYYDGIHALNIYAERTWIKNTTDGFRVYNTGGGAINFLGEGCLSESMAQFAPDYVNSRTETHDDAAQMQGTTAAGLTAADVYFDGCKLDARHSTTKGNIPPYRTQLSALMLTPNVGPVHSTFTRGWLRGGMYCINAVHASLSSTSHLTVTSTRFERPGTGTNAPSVAFAVKSGSTLTLVQSGNTYIDNAAAVSVTYI